MDDLPSLSDSLGLLVMNTFFYLLLAWYFGQVRPPPDPLVVLYSLGLLVINTFFYLLLACRVLTSEAHGRLHSVSYTHLRAHETLMNL
eukprot:1183889-Prorocentrum_minimum.AAC.3